MGHRPCLGRAVHFGGRRASGLRARRARFVFRTAQSLNKWYPPPFNCFERYVLRCAAGWICSGQLVAANLAKRRGYAERPMARIPLGVDTTIFRPDAAAECDPSIAGMGCQWSSGCRLPRPLRRGEGPSHFDGGAGRAADAVASATSRRRKAGKRTARLGGKVSRQPRSRTDRRFARSRGTLCRGNGHPGRAKPDDPDLEGTIWPNVDRRNGLRGCRGRQRFRRNPVCHW